MRRRSESDQPLAILRGSKTVSIDEFGAVDEFHSGLGELGFDGGDGAVEVDGAAGVAEDDGFKSLAAGVECGVADAVIVGQAGEEDAGEAALAQVAG